MEHFPKPGDFCPNQACTEFQKLQSRQSKPNIIKAGKTRTGVQRFKCKTRGKYFVETTGSIFYRKRTAEGEILETLALLAESNHIHGLTCIKEHKEDTILNWLRETAQHGGTVEEALMKKYWIQRGQ
jgi:transposase-like protein